MNMLKDIQIDVLKLDMAFESSDYSAKGGNILTAILKVAESLKMQTIAEGVETKEQVEFREKYWLVNMFRLLLFQAIAC